jgi:glycosyltransferase involved in cell wall biosynthesis
MSVSIVINNYNYGRFLDEAIRSALEQKEPALEVIVVDDGSTDNSRAIIESFGSRVTAIYQENGGQAAAFNTGIRAANGDWVWLLDADDCLKPDAVRKARGLIEPGVSRIAMGMERIDSPGHHIDIQLPNGGINLTGSLRDLILEHGGLPSVPTSGNLFSREALLTISPVPEASFRICADAYLFVMSAKCGLTKLDSSVVACYRVHGGNNFFRMNMLARDPKALTRELDNVMLTLGLLENYGQTLSKTDGRKIRSFWVGDQVLLAVLRAKIAHISHPALAEWPWHKLLLSILGALFQGPQRFETRRHKCREAIKLVLNHVRRVPQPSPIQ